MDYAFTTKAGQDRDAAGLEISDDFTNHYLNHYHSHRRNILFPNEETKQYQPISPIDQAFPNQVVSSWRQREQKHHDAHCHFHSHQRKKHSSSLGVKRETILKHMTKQTKTGPGLLRLEKEDDRKSPPSVPLADTLSLTWPTSQQGEALEHWPKHSAQDHKQKKHPSRSTYEVPTPTMPFDRGRQRFSPLSSVDFGLDLMPLPPQSKDSSLDLLRFLHPEERWSGTDSNISKIKDMAHTFMANVCLEFGQGTFCIPPVRRSQHADKSSKQLMQVAESERRVIGSFLRFFTETCTPVFMLCHYPLAGFLRNFKRKSPATSISTATASGRETLTLMLVSATFPLTLVTVTNVSGNSEPSYVLQGLTRTATHMEKSVWLVSNWLARGLGLRAENIRQILACPNIKRSVVKKICRDKALKQQLSSYSLLTQDEMCAPFEDEFATRDQREAFKWWMLKELLGSPNALPLEDLRTFVGALLCPELSRVDHLHTVYPISPLSLNDLSDKKSVTAEDVSQLKLTIDGVTQGFDEFMDTCIRHYYPELETRTYRVPPVHFNKQAFSKRSEIAQLLEKTLLQQESFKARANEEDDGDVSVGKESSKMGKEESPKGSVGADDAPVTVTDDSQLQVVDGVLKRVELPQARTMVLSNELRVIDGMLKVVKMKDKEAKDGTARNKSASSLGFGPDVPSANFGHHRHSSPSTEPENIASQGKTLSREANRQESVKQKLSALEGVEVLSKVMAKDERADEGENRVVSAFEHLGRCFGPMFILCSYQYNNYLNKLREEMFSKVEVYRPPRAFGPALRAEHDCLIFSKTHGATVVCIKSVGDNFAAWAQSKEECEATVRKTLSKAVKQLDREVAVIRHVTSDICPDLPCHKLVALPNLKRADVRAALDGDAQLAQTVDSLTMGLSCVLCQDELPAKFDSVWDPQDRTVLDRLSRWWVTVQQGVLAEGQDHPVDMKVYRQIIGRYCGLFSTVEVWTPTNPRVEVRSLSEATSVCAQRYAKMVLLPEQVEILANPSRRVNLYGPPGSGKTLLLILKARQWLQEGHRVVLLNVRLHTTRGYPCAYGMERRLRTMVPGGKLKMVNIEALNFSPDDLADVGDLPSTRVIMDEVTPSTHKIIDLLCQKGISELWCAGIFSEDQPPAALGFTSFPMDKILRCPPILQSLLKHTEHDVRQKTPYRKSYVQTALQMSVPWVTGRRERNSSSSDGEEKVVGPGHEQSALGKESSTEHKDSTRLTHKDPGSTPPVGNTDSASVQSKRNKDSEYARSYDDHLCMDRTNSKSESDISKTSQREKHEKKNDSASQEATKSSDSQPWMKIEDIASSNTSHSDQAGEKRGEDMDTESSPSQPHFLGPQWYSPSSARQGLATDGPRPHIIDHLDHHSKRSPMDCHTCGQQLADFLFSMVSSEAEVPFSSSSSHPHRRLSKNKYAFKKSRDSSVILSNSSSIHTSGRIGPGMKRERLIGGQALSWSQVLIVSAEVDPNSPLISVLRARRIPVEVVLGEDCKRIESSENKLFVTLYKEVTGLERALIVFVPASEQGEEGEEEDEGRDPIPDLMLGNSLSRFHTGDRLALWYIASRSLSSLVLILP